ncbi:hypothetical protein RKE29_11740 [Streptomyces sp. B1866]|uniref:hypothetical protein n=1 Tax=Streptomyces sp. B1866 TaxID=3075431 RepID=UPI00288E08C8|nr:hypothetical protein [Streptomyces sp. B1866]MDT3397311.1 hypothetical protein [Streptomyces sp. B1866]
MPLTPEEPQIRESVPGPRATPAAGQAAPTPRPVPGPGPRPAPRRPGGPGADRGPAAAQPHAPAPLKTPTPSLNAPRPAAPAASPGASRRTEGGPTPPSSPQVQLIPAPVEGALDAADEAVDLLLDSGRAPGDILVLTTGGAHPWAAHELSFGEASYWAQHDAGDDVFYAAADARRATGRPVVVVAVNGGEDQVVARALPDAMRRAGTLLIVCGDPQRINTLISAGV